MAGGVEFGVSGRLSARAGAGVQVSSEGDIAPAGSGELDISGLQWVGDTFEACIQPGIFFGSLKVFGREAAPISNVGFGVKYGIAPRLADGSTPWTPYVTASMTFPDVSPSIAFNVALGFDFDLYHGTPSPKATGPSTIGHFKLAPEYKVIASPDQVVHQATLSFVAEVDLLAK